MLFSNQIYFKYNYSTRVIWDHQIPASKSQYQKGKKKSQRQTNSKLQIIKLRLEYMESHQAENASFLADRCIVHPGFLGSSEGVLG